MKRTAILLEDVVDDFEFVYPYYRMLEAGFAVDIIAPEKKGYTSKHGLPLTADIAAKDADADAYDGLFIPGGYAPDRLRRDPVTVAFVSKIARADKPTAAVCHAGWMLISAGAVKWRTLTGFFSIKDDLVNAGATYTGNTVEVDGNLVTGTDPSALPGMMKAFIPMVEAGG